MKSKSVKAERKFFPTFDLRLSYKTAIKFAAEGICLFLLASVGEFGFALSLGLFCGFVYARQNILALAPVFIIASCVFMQSWWTILYSVAPVAILILLYFVFFKFRRNVPLWAVALASLVGMTPYIACTCVFYGGYLLAGVAAVVEAVCAFASGTSAYALLVRGPTRHINVDEMMALGAVAVAFSYALSGADFWGFKLVYIVAGFALTLFATCFKAQLTLFAALIMGLGVCLQTGDMACLAGVAALGAVAVIFSPFTKWASALGILAAQAAMWLFDAYVGAGWRALIMTSVGVIGCLALPKSALYKLKALAAADNKNVYGGIVQRHSRGMASRLQAASEVFYEMSKGLESELDARTVYSADRLAHEVARGYCGKCADREGCFKALGADTYSVLKPMAEAALNRGKASILDMPPFITSRCAKTHTLAAVINGGAQTYLKKRESADGILIGKKMMSEQFAGVALILDSLAEQCAAPVSFASDDVEELKAELLKHNIVASEVVVSKAPDSCSLTALVRAADANKQALEKIVSAFLRRRMCKVREYDRGEFKIVCLESAPTYEVAYGISRKCREGEAASGDSTSVLCPTLGRRLFAISDGMGSGESAAKASRDAIAMIESFYRAGFENGIILSLVNKLLRIRLEDSFTSLDIAVIDAVSGGLDVIKLGASSSFIIRKDGIEMLSCSQPPAGIVDGVLPLTNRYQLYDGDALVMMSDGVEDALGFKGVSEAVEAADCMNPQRLADELLSSALKAGAKDDCTVIALRLFAV